MARQQDALHGWRGDRHERADAGRPSALLLATLGTKPQVVTTTLDLLLADGIHIHAVWLIVPTSPILMEARAQLRAEFETFPRYRGIDLRDPVLADSQGPVPDADTETVARRTMSALFQTVRDARLALPARPIHLSLVGGRKLLAVAALAAAQLLFAEEDRLWYTAVSAEFAASGRLHPHGPDDARLVPVPVLSLGSANSLWLDPQAAADPFAASAEQRARQLRLDLELARSFVLGSLSAAERRVLEVLVREGASNSDIGQRLHLSPRTVERHLGEVSAKAALHWDLPPPVSRTQLVALLAQFFRFQAEEAIAGKPA